MTLAPSQMSPPFLIRFSLVTVPPFPLLILVMSNFPLALLAFIYLMFLLFLPFTKIFFLLLNSPTIIMLALLSFLWDILFVTYTQVLFSFRADVVMAFIRSYHFLHPTSCLLQSQLFLPSSCRLFSIADWVIRPIKCLAP